jgi:2-polyprenyl-3-methyl-5-hydroxy-6-metoxy-1,4-benzoquinol methylase
MQNRMTQPTTPADQAQQAEALVERLFGDLLGVITTYGVYIGDRLGLYRALSEGGRATPADLASRAGIAERYAREWLEQRAADGILSLVSDSPDPARRSFELPHVHAEVLTDDTSLNYFAPFMRLLIAGGNQMPAILDAYCDGTGVNWADYGDDMRESQGDANKPLFLNQLGEYIAQLPQVHERLQQPGARVADIGTGFGWSAIGVAEAYPNAIVDSYDLDAPAMDRATEHARERGVGDRVTFHARDAAEAEGSYDLVLAFECIHDMPQPVGVLATMRQLAGDNGTVIVMDENVAEQFEAPANEVDRLFYGYSLLVCLPDGMSHQPSVGTGTVMRPATLRGYAQEAGFADIEILPLENDFFRFYRLA